jgi:glycerol-3-phosphate acyltransferase PlsY
MAWKIVLAATIGYLLGSINSSLIIGKLFYKKDIRKYGSGNAGTTNTLRTFGKRAAAAVLAGDLLKGILAVLIGCGVAGSTTTGEYTGGYLAGLFSIIGHNWPVYFGFKGGKGVLTSFAVVLMFSPVAALLCLAGFIVIVAITKYVSLGSMVCAALFPLMAFMMGEPMMMIWVGAILALLIIMRHGANIRRLIHGNEKKLSFKRNPEKVA